MDKYLKTITIIDSFGFFFRSHYAMPYLKNRDGFPTGLLTGFINFVDTLKKDHNTDYILFALDSKGSSFRADIYPEYKANRSEAPEEIKLQLPIAIEWISKMGFANIAMDGYEADDIIASVATMAKDRGIKVRIASHDKDLYQMIEDEQIVIYDAIKKKEISTKDCIEKFNVKPQDFRDFQAILGDSSDNIKGVKGIGQKGASELINEFHTLENIYENIEKLPKERTKKLLLESKEMAFISRELVSLKQDLFDELDFDAFLYDENVNYLSNIMDDLHKYQLYGAIKKSKEMDLISAHQKNEARETISISKEKVTPKKSGFNAIRIDNINDLNRVIDKITPQTIVAFDTETTGLDTKKASIVGFSFSFDDENAYYVPIAHNYLGVGKQVSLDDALSAIEKIFKAKIVGQNLKFDLSLLYRYNIQKITPFGDSMILAWLIDSTARVGLDYLAKKYFNYEMKKFSEVVKKGDDFSTVDIDDASFYASEDAWMSRKLYFLFQEMVDIAILEEAINLEFPFINTLIDIEKEGIEVDTSRLYKLQYELEIRLEELSQKIYEVCGCEFNIRSTQQLGVVLFEQLNLKGSKKTKSGYSTDESVLLSLSGEHEVIKYLLEYREVQKMLSTYILPLLKLALMDDKRRIYTSFVQTGTATGRLSSKEPNLQNIPIRSELGKKVRNVFVAKKGYKLLSIDYSQIELRLLAHFSGDEALVNAFNNDEDIHMATAIKLFGEDVAKHKRDIAKTVNFGLLYGMGVKKLSAQLSISSAEAKEIIKNYFDSFPTVKTQLEKIQEEAKTKGYIETLLKRRRVFDYSNASAMQQAGILRESINSVFQGSAADLIKLSMVKINDIIHSENLDAKILLQIHDELIFEVKEDITNEIGARFKEIMESIYKLNIPLKCSLNIASSWGELK